MTSHIIQDVEKVVDDTIIMGYQKLLLKMPLETLKKDFHRFEFRNANAVGHIKADDDSITNVEFYNDKVTLYSFKNKSDVIKHLKTLGISVDDLTEVSMTLEEAFIGLTGKY